MDRAWKANAALTPMPTPLAFSTGYAQSNNPVTGTTVEGPWWFHMVTEEIVNTISTSGITPSPLQTNQLATAIQAMITRSIGTGGSSMVQEAANITALRALSKAGPPLALVAGYWAAGDGGNGIFACNPTPGSPLVTPTLNAATTATTGGALAAGTYYYRLTAYNAVGETLASTEISKVTTGATSTITHTWSAVSGATGYRIYGRTTGAEQYMTAILSGLTWTDDGSIQPMGAMPSANTTLANNGSTVLATDGGLWTRLISGAVSAFAFGSKFDGTTDDWAPNQALLHFCQQLGGVATYPIQWPPGKSYNSSRLVIEGTIKMSGAGAESSVLIGAQNEVLTTFVPLSSSSDGAYYSDFGCAPVSAAGGANGFVLRVNKAGAAFSYIANFTVSRISCGDFGGYGLVLDNSAMNQDGIFVGSVQRCKVANGVRGYGIGDSVNIEMNEITDGASRQATFAGGNIGIFLSGIAGAAQCVLRSNNITTGGGSVALIGMLQPQIQNNQCEFPSYYGMVYRAGTSSYGAMVYLENCIEAGIKGNTINPGTDMYQGWTIFGGTLASGSKVITGMYIGAGGVAAGCQVFGIGIPQGARVKSFTTGSGTATITLTMAATTAGFSALRISTPLPSGPRSGQPGCDFLTITGTHPAHGVSSTPTVTALSSTTGLLAGQTYNGDGVVPGTYILSVNVGAATLVLSQDFVAGYAGAAGVTASIGLSPDNAIVLNGSSSLNNRLEAGNNLTSGNVSHISLQGTTSLQPAITFDGFNTFTGAPSERLQFLANPNGSILPAPPLSFPFAQFPDPTLCQGAQIWDQTSNFMRWSDGVSWNAPSGPWTAVVTNISSNLTGGGGVSFVSNTSFTRTGNRVRCAGLATLYIYATTAESFEISLPVATTIGAGAFGPHLVGFIGGSPGVGGDSLQMGVLNGTSNLTAGVFIPAWDSVGGSPPITRVCNFLFEYDVQ